MSDNKPETTHAAPRFDLWQVTGGGTVGALMMAIAANQGATGEVHALRVSQRELTAEVRAVNQNVQSLAVTVGQQQTRIEYVERHQQRQRVPQ